MSLSRDSRQEKKLKALKRAQFALKQRFERIDFEEDVINPLIEDYKAGKPVLGLPAAAAFLIWSDRKILRSAILAPNAESISANWVFCSGVNVMVGETFCSRSIASS